ncbi:MAG: Xaa-Pro peptidase family protein [Lachnospiraceae bacterium]|nr:Xaa-Pro peptidase family protein [Lachnospiraceae bacterium]
MDYAKRIKNLRERMERTGVDAALIANDASWEYMVGLPRGGHDNTKQRQNSLEFACLLVTQKLVTAFCPRLSALGFSWRMEQFSQVDKLVIYPDADIYGENFDREITAQGLDGKYIGLTRDISSMVALRLIDKHGAKVKDISAELDEMRALKDEEEIELMRHASGVADRIYYDILPMLVPGTRIREIEHEIERLLETYDCSYSSFSAEVLNYGPKAGNRIGEPYAILEEDHTIAFDYGVVYQGYCSDFGRTVFLREPTPELRRCHELVMEAQQAALDAAKVGVSRCCELNEACHRVMKEAGMDAHFIHRMGHGIGKDVHERPFMAEGEETIVRPGMCFTDEPSLFLAGKGLVRVEDVVLTTPSGFEYLNSVTKEIVVLG